MTTAFPEVVRRLDDLGLEVLRATPRGPDHLLLTLRDADGAVLPAQWHDDPARAGRVARDTGGADLVRRPDPHVVVQLGGADRRLPGLRPLLGSAGRVLVAHRPERRATVRHGAPEQERFTKVVRPGRAGPVAAALERARHGGVPAPRVVDCDETTGTVTASAVPGTPLYDAWLDDRWRADLPQAGRQVGRAVRALHRLPRRGLPVHGPAEELATSRRWLDLADAHGVLPLPRSAADALLDEAARRLSEHRSPALGAIHRDLHDKQLVLDDRRVFVLDLDTLAAGDPALDLANLLVHLDLRVNQERAPTPLADAVGAALLDGYRPGRATLGAMAGYALTTRLRLAAVYAFRPGQADAALALLG